MARKTTKSVGMGAAVVATAWWSAPAADAAPAYAGRYVSHRHSNSPWWITAIFLGLAILVWVLRYLTARKNAEARRSAETSARQASGPYVPGVVQAPNVPPAAVNGGNPQTYQTGGPQQGVPQPIDVVASAGATQADAPPTAGKAVTPGATDSASAASQWKLPKR